MLTLPGCSSDGDLDLVVGSADGTLRYFRHDDANVKRNDVENDNSTSSRRNQVNGTEKGHGA